MNNEVAELKEHMPLVKHIAFNFYMRLSDRSKALLDLDDFIQAGSIGLLKAIRNYDPSRGTKFSTYAWPLIRGEVFEEFHRMFGLHSHGKGRKYGPKNKDEVGEDFDNAIRRSTDLHAFEGLLFRKILVAEYLAMLPSREKFVLRQLYLKGSTLERTSQALGVTRERVRQIRNETVAKIQLGLYA